MRRQRWEWCDVKTGSVAGGCTGAIKCPAHPAAAAGITGHVSDAPRPLSWLDIQLLLLHCSSCGCQLPR
jgi:hypothetical protein